MEWFASLLFPDQIWPSLIFIRYYLDANKTAGEKARQQLQKNAASNIEQVLEATPTKHQLYSHLPPITKTIQVRWTRHARHCWRSKDELISDVLLWTPTYGQVKAGWPAWTYIHTAALWGYDVALKTCQRRWTIGRSGERGSGISVLMARHDDDDDDEVYCICEKSKWALANN